jgi:hypothetical protein
MQGPLAPSSSQINYDKEYIWDEQRNTFIFYDDNTKNPATGTMAEWSNPKYQETGDVGNPGDLIEVGSPDQQLYAAQAYGFSFVSVPQNLNGNSDVQFVILNGDNFSILPNRNASQPEEGLETWRSVSDTELYAKPDSIDQPLTNIFKFPNPKKSWRQAMADGEPNVSDWERSPVMMAGIGPYSIAPGDSIQFTLLYCAGEMDRQLSGYGGVDAIKQLDMDFLDSPDDHAAIQAFRANWDTAMELVDKKALIGFYAIEENIPPPTAGDPPRIGSDDVLTAEATSIPKEGVNVSGIKLTWIKVPDNYVDPITNVNDFAGYRVYRSDISRVGPWTEIADIAKGNAQLDATGTRVVHSVEALAGVPYYYAVSTYDSEGNESAKTAYTYDPIGAKPAPQDENMDLVRVVPNPFRQVRDPLNPVDQKKLIFLNIPSKCTIRIYNLAGHHIRTLEHDDGFGEEAWGSTGTISDFMLTENRNNIQPGLYVYHIESHVQGHEGESVIGKFVVIK